MIKYWLTDWQKYLLSCCHYWKSNSFLYKSTFFIRWLFFINWFSSSINFLHHFTFFNKQPSSPINLWLIYQRYKISERSDISERSEGSENIQDVRDLRDPRSVSSNGSKRPISSILYVQSLSRSKKSKIWEVKNVFLSLEFLHQSTFFINQFINQRFT